MNIIEFKNAKELENQLAIQIASKLDVAIKKNGKAHLLVSGGSSPIGMFHLLSLKQIDWQHVTIGLVDERFVSINDNASNEKLIKENLMINEASKATCISMIYKIDDEVENLLTANSHYKLFHHSIDVCVLGMGEDGHTASIFPSDAASELNLLSDSLNLVSTKSPNEPTHRISCPKALLLRSDSLYLMILGESKKVVLQQAANKKLPISYFTNIENKVADIYYSQKNKS